MTDPTDPHPDHRPPPQPGDPPGEHADKYNDPRARITTRGIWIGVAVALAAIVMAGLSICLRRTQLEKTTEFWGETTIRALQLADKVHLLPAGAEQDDEQFEPVELTAVPGLGHLRRALLDERHYRWETATDRPVAEKCAEEQAFCVRLRLADPRGQRVPTTEILLELNGGWVGPADGSKRVRVNDRVQPALRHQLTTWMDL